MRASYKHIVDEIYRFCRIENPIPEWIKEGRKSTAMNELKPFDAVKECEMCGAPRSSFKFNLHEEQFSDLTSKNLLIMGLECCVMSFSEGRIRRHLRIECSCGWLSGCLTAKDTATLGESSLKYEIAVKGDKVFLSLNGHPFILNIIFARGLAIALLDHTHPNKGENSQ